MVAVRFAGSTASILRSHGRSCAILWVLRIGLELVHLHVFCLFSQRVTLVPS